MTQDDTYRARAQTVRLAARAQLLEMRRTRLAKRAGPALVGGLDVPDDPETDDTVALLQDEAGPGDVTDGAAADLPDDLPPDAVAVVPADALADAPPQIEEAAVATPPKAAAKPKPKPKPKAPATPPAKRAAKEQTPPAGVAGTFVPKPRVSAFVTPPPAAPPLVADPDDLSVLAAAMSEIDDDASADAMRLPAAPLAVTEAVPEDVPERALESAHLPEDPPEAIAQTAPDPEPDPEPAPELMADPSSTPESVPQDVDASPPPEPELAAAISPAEPAAPEADGFAGPESTMPQDAPVDVAQPAEPQAPVGLYALPGAGPGLVWMLGQVGIDSMDDLARADADDLGRKLGLVGQILNVGSWVDFARSAENRSARP